MIKTPDYKIEVRFDQYNEPYYKMYRKDEPYAIRDEDYRELADTFGHLSLVIEKHIEKMEKIEKMKQEAELKDQLKNLDVNQARSLLSYEGKRLWVSITNAKTGGRGYTLADDGDIVEVPMEGVWH